MNTGINNDAANRGLGIIFVLILPNFDNQQLESKCDDLYLDLDLNPFPSPLK